MRSADQEHQLEGRVRGWDGLIILLRVPVSYPLFSPPASFHAPFILRRSDLDYFPFVLIEFMDSFHLLLKTISD